MRTKKLGLICAALVGGLVLYALQAYGVIGPPYAKADKVQIVPEGKPTYTKVLLLGTSLTSRGDWAEQLEEQLTYCGISVERLARPAANSQWGLSQLREWYATGNQAGLVVVEFSGNDASPIHGMSLSASKQTHYEIVDLVRQNRSIVTLATMSPGWNINAIERPGQNRYHAIYREMAGSKIGLIDTIDVWRGLSDNERKTLVPDDLHPTNEAMTTVATPHFQEHIQAVFCSQHENLNSETECYVASCERQ